MRTVLIPILLLSLSHFATAQNEDQGLFLNAFPTKDSLVLRWATNAPAIYEAGKQNGYLLQKATANDEAFITLSTIRPYSEAEIQETLLEKPEDDATQIAAHILQNELVTALGGEPEITAAFDHNNKIMVALNFVMLAADLSATAGNMLGLRHVINDYPVDEKAI